MHRLGSMAGFTFTFAPALSLFAAFQRVSPVRPLRTFVRTTEEHFRPQQLLPHQPVEHRAQDAMLSRGGAGLHQRATILHERGRGRAARKGGGLDAPMVQLTTPGTFELWMRRHGKWGGQSKMPRCRSDREIADELAALEAAE